MKSGDNANHEEEEEEDEVTRDDSSREDDDDKPDDGNIEFLGGSKIFQRVKFSL